LKKILIIDDEEDFCLFFKRNLELVGNFKVIIATNGKKGILLARQHKPDVIILDLVMPRTSGLEILKRLKENKNTLSIPVIVLTVKDDDESRIKTLELFSEDYIVKPTTASVLGSRIESVLSRLGKG